MALSVIGRSEADNVSSPSNEKPFTAIRGRKFARLRFGHVARLARLVRLDLQSSVFCPLRERPVRCYTPQLRSPCAHTRSHHEPRTEVSPHALSLPWFLSRSG